MEYITNYCHAGYSDWSLLLLFILCKTKEKEKD